MKPTTDGTRFDGITVDSETFDHDIVIRLSGKRVLSKDAIREMEKDQTGGAEQKSATLARLTAGSKYGLGEWLDRTNENGQGVEISSPGAFGFRPWIDRENDLLGVFVVEIRDRRTKRALARMGNIQDQGDLRAMATGPIPGDGTRNGAV
jgi:hypothetical protein